MTARTSASSARVVAAWPSPFSTTKTGMPCSAFYEDCPVLRSEGEVRSSRLALAAATREVLAQGLHLLGIEAPDRM